MVATPERIGFITQPYRKALTAIDTTVAAAYGELARATNIDEPEETLFDDIADTQAIADERLALFSAERGRYQAGLPDGLSFALELDYSTASPTGTVIDPERDINKPAIATEITFDLRRDGAAIALWG